MAAFVIRRVLWGIVTLVAVIFVTFLLFRIFPGADPVTLLAGKGATPERERFIRQELGLNHSWIVQFWLYLKGIILHGNLGYSFFTNRPVLGEVTQALPATVSLTVGAAVLWFVLGIPVGILSAVRRGSIWDRAAMTGSLMFVSMPVFWFALILIYLFAKSLGIVSFLPGPGSYVGLTADPVHWFTSLIMPWLVLALTQAAIYSRLLRGSLLDAMSDDYIRTAQERAQVDTEHGQHRRDGRAHAVLHDHGPFRQPLGPGGANVVLPHRVQQIAAKEPGVDGGLGERQHQPGQDQRGKPVDRVRRQPDIAAGAGENRDESE
jgi:peptide/nickel transport system permease protein